MRREQVFWGWGEPGAGPSLPEHAVPFLREALGIDGAVVDRPVALEDVRLREPALDPAVRRRLEEIVGADAVRDDREARVLRCRGKSYLDLLAQRAGECEDAPDAIVAPADHDQVLAVVQACAEAGVAVVPFGGGTSVVGGLEPDRGPFGALVSLDLARMDRLLGVDERSLTAVLEPGIRLPEADRALAAHGLTLGHVPQSYEWATVGGCVATRSAGQTSTGHGRIDENVVAVRCATPLGELATLRGAGQRRRAVAARGRGRLGGRARRDHERRAAGPSAGGDAAVRGLVRAGVRGRLRRPPAARAARCGARRRAPVGRGRDALHARPGRHRRGRSRGDPRPPARRARLPAGARRGRAPPKRSRAGGGMPRGCCAARARSSWGRGPAAPGPPRGSPARTCATTCSTAA